MYASMHLCMHAHGRRTVRCRAPALSKRIAQSHRLLMRARVHVRLRVRRIRVAFVQAVERLLGWAASIDSIRAWNLWVEF